jgi:hypothetical protein
MPQFPKPVGSGKLEVSANLKYDNKIGSIAKVLKMEELMQREEKIGKNKTASKAQQKSIARVSHLSLQDCQRRATA